MSPAPCKDCQRRPKVTGRHRCVVCALRVAPIGEQVEASRRRRAMIPDELARKRVPPREWPAGQRWCAACQSYRDLEDFADGASRCRPCASSATHGARIAKTYGLSPADYDRLLALQGGRCAICRGRPKSKRAAVDHDHKSGAVRGLLCSRCNAELLTFADHSAQKLWNAYVYLTTPPATVGDAWEPHIATPPALSAAPGDERPAPRPSAPAAFASPSDGRSAPRSAQGGDALAAALERARAPREPYAPVKAALDELDAAIESGELSRIRDAVEAVRARGLLVPTDF